MIENLLATHPSMGSAEVPGAKLEIARAIHVFVLL